MPSCAINGPGHMPRPERRSHGCQSGCGERRLKAGRRPRREPDSVRLEPVIDVADPSAITLRPLTFKTVAPLFERKRSHGLLYVGCTPPGPQLSVFFGRAR